MENKINPIKQFAIFKNDKATGNQPGYDMVGKDEQGNRLRLGSLWLKDHNGTKFYSGQMKDEYTKDDGTYYDGYVIITEKEYNALKGNTAPAPEPESNINPDDIPF